MLFENPIRLNDTLGFGEPRGTKYDEKIILGIKNLFETTDIKNFNAVCLVFKSTWTRNTDRFQIVMNKLYSLFREEKKI